MREKTLTDRIIDTINATRNARAVKVHGGAFSNTGEPDIFACRAWRKGTQGLMYTIEVKKPGQKPRKIQQWCLDQWKNAGAVAICVDNYEQFKQMWEENGS